MIDTLRDWFSDFDIVTFAVFTAVVQALAVLAAMEAVLKTRTAQGAIAWSLSLLMMPTLMLPLYWVFGRRKFRGYAKARRIGKLALQRPETQLAQLRTAAVAPYQRVLEQIAQMPFTVGNQPQLLIDGERTFAALFDMIAQARSYILLEYYIVRDDRIGEQVRLQLLAKAAQGVKVYFLYDEIGSFQLGRRFLSSLREGGVDIRSFHTTKGRRNRFQLNFRNHRKIAVIDGEIGMLGGANIGDEYLGHHTILTPWRDTSVLLRGPAVIALQLAFVEDWYWACEQIPPLSWTPQRAADPGVDILVMPTGPADQLESCALFFQQMAHAAQERLWIVSPYFVPDAAVINALQLAALRGVDVRILLPEKADKRLVWLSSFAYLDEVQSTGIQVYRYQAGFLHQKVWLVDDDCATIGTANLDNRSFRLNFEVGVVIRDRGFARQVEAMLSADFAQSRLLRRGELAARGLLFRLLVRSAYLLAPVQ
jgi:cardiolipin synthase A/B